MVQASSKQFVRGFVNAEDSSMFLTPDSKVMNSWPAKDHLAHGICHLLVFRKIYLLTRNLCTCFTIDNECGYLFYLLSVLILFSCKNTMYEWMSSWGAGNKRYTSILLSSLGVKHCVEEKRFILGYWTDFSRLKKLCCTK